MSKQTNRTNPFIQANVLEALADDHEINVTYIEGTVLSMRAKEEDPAVRSSFF